MAFAITNRIDAPSGVNVASVTSASFTPTANSLVVVLAGAEDEVGSTTPSWTISSSPTLTWTLQKASAFPGGNFSGTANLWTTTVGASPASMTVTVTPGSSAGEVIHLRVIDVTGYDTGTTVRQSGTGNTGTNPGTTSSTLALTLNLGSTPRTDSLVLIGYFTSGTSGAAIATTPTGYTSVTGNPTVGDSNGVAAFLYSSTSSASATCGTSSVGTNVYWGAAVAVEIYLSGSAPGSGVLAPGVVVRQAMKRASYF